MIINDENLLQKLNELLKNKYLNDKQWSKLLYRSTRDGCRASDFHSHCDNKPRTLTIIKATSGNIFGGFKKLITNANEYDKGSFIFSLVNNENRTLVFEQSEMDSWMNVSFKLKQKRSSRYVEQKKSISLNKNVNVSLNGPIFGSDIVICDNFDSCNRSYSDLGVNYSHPDFTRSSVKAQSFLAGSFNFQVAEIEVFQINNDEEDYDSDDYGY